MSTNTFPKQARGNNTFLEKHSIIIIIIIKDFEIVYYQLSTMMIIITVYSFGIQTCTTLGPKLLLL